MRFSQLFPSRFLKAADLDGPEVVKIAKVTTEELGDGDIKPIVYFEGKPQGLVLNVTNGRTLQNLYGDETDHWCGQPIKLITTTTDFAGRTVDCIRLRKPDGKPAGVRLAGLDNGGDEVAF